MRLATIWAPILVAISATVSMAQSGDYQVTTNNGVIEGEAENGVRVFRGIPFAKPPVGELRWRDPQPVTPWSGVRAATDFAPNCYQDPPHAWEPYTSEFLIDDSRSEDCLYLNVWSPAAAKDLPVYVWIHGGGFSSGSGSVRVYNGSNLASKGAVVVTINYRVGVFGFLAHPDLTSESALKSSGNYGLLDMIEALKWVKDNAARFGGDPDNIMIAGQSAGATAVNGLMLSPLAKGLFHKAAVLSGVNLGIGMAKLEEAEVSGAVYLKSTGRKSIAELRSLSSAEIASSAKAVSGQRGQPAPPSPVRFGPNLDQAVIAGDISKPESSIQSNVPLLTGYLSDEYTLNSPADYSPENFEQGVRRRYGTHADTFLSLYPHATYAQAFESSKLMARDRYMAGTLIWAEKRTKATGQAIYLYLFDQAYPTTADRRFGSFHTSEVPYIFGALDPKSAVFDVTDYDAARNVQTAWLQFMRTGDPNSSLTASWPQVEGTASRVMRIGSTSGMIDAVSSPERLAGWRRYAASGASLPRY
jgi:para-nitrobenzyl esterase